MRRPGFDVAGFLDERGRPASVATTTKRGNTALAMMWFVAEENRLWFHTPSTDDRPTPFLDAARHSREVAVMVATFASFRPRTVSPARSRRRRRPPRIDAERGGVGGGSGHAGAYPFRVT